MPTRPGALGSHGRETFGVGSKGINTFTGWTAAVFLGSALLLHYLNRTEGVSTPLDSLGDPAQGAPAVQPGEALPVAPPTQPPVPPPGGDGR